MDGLAHWDVYQKLLSQRSYGLPLWHGDPYGYENEIEIGDVGYVFEGKFYRIFNVKYSDTRALNAHHEVNVPESYRANVTPPYPNCFGVPPDHTPFNCPDILGNLDNPLCGVIHSSGQYSSSSSGPGGLKTDSTSMGIDFDFGEDVKAGAALVLLKPAVRMDIHQSLLRDYAHDRWMSWEKFAETIPQRCRHGAELSLVYGHAKTTAWASMVAYSRDSSSSLRTFLSLPIAGGVRANYTHSVSMTTSTWTNHGPQPSTSATSQVIDEALTYSDPVIDATFSSASPSDISPDERLFTGDSQPTGSLFGNVVSPFSGAATFFSNVASFFNITALVILSFFTHQTPSEEKCNQTVFIKRLKSRDRSFKKRVTEGVEVPVKFLTDGTNRSKENEGSGASEPPGTPPTFSAQMRDTDGGSGSPRMRSQGETFEEDARSLHSNQDVDFQYDPLDILLEYLLKNAPGAQRAIVSDDDLFSVYELHKMTSSESQLLDLVDLMEKLSPPTREVNGTAQLALETYRNDDILLWKLTGEPLDAIVCEGNREPSSPTSASADLKELVGKQPDNRPHYRDRPHWPFPDLTGQVVKDNIPFFGSTEFASVDTGVWNPANGTQQKVIIKILTKSCEDDEIENIYEEISAWVHLEHSNILPFYGICKNFGLFPALVSKHCGDLNISEFLQSTINADRYSLVKGISRGIQYLHICEIVHGDLNPHNIIVDEDGCPRICDFGYFNLKAYCGFTAPLVATRYAAPELLIDEFAAPTREADIYSGAMVHLEVLSDRRPFYYFEDSIRDEMALKAEVMSGARPVFERHACELLTDQICLLLSACWHERPLERPNAGKVLEKLEVIIS